ncbi:MAG: Ig-like domain-containing protein, partial [Lachnospiraceae bacterium]|nr:Ig-like domain-containing protein [Lachnospiraceae bacterium]
VTLPPRTNQDNYVWYSFTAPKAGRYAFYTKEGFSRAVSIGFYGAPDKDAAIRVTSSSSSQALTVTTNYMEKGETVYFGTYTYKDDGSLTYTMWAAYQTALTKNGDGSYTAKLSDGDAVTLRPRAGKSRIQVEVVEAFNSSHVLQACVCPADHSEGDSFVPRDSGVDASTPGKTTYSGTLSEGSYETSFVISRNVAREGFVALLTGMDPIAIKGASSEDIVYVHDAVCEKNSITLDMEFLVKNSNYLVCQYQPADGSAKAQTIQVEGWKKFVFRGLNEGTEYRFEIQDGASNEVLKTFSYSTKDTRVPFEDARAEISKDFSTLTVRANPRYSGTDGVAYLSCRMIDSVGRKCEFSKSLSVDDREAGGYFTVDFDMAETGLFLKPAVSYVVEIGMTFQQDKVSTVRMKIDDVRSPKMAYLEETDIAFQVEQEASDENGNPQVKLTAAVQGFTGSKKVAVFYRSVNGLREYGHCVMELKDGKGEQVLGLPMASIGTDYEFVLTAGGAEKRVTCSIENELGVHLERVQAASDEVGPFHFVHTYRLTGDGKLTDSYYLQLQAYSLLPTDKWGYKNVGEPVELNGTNGYQTAFSTAAAGWVPYPDSYYRLRWLVGKSADVDTNSKDLLAVSYESLRTGKPHITLERVGGSCNSQGHKITLGEADVAVLKEYDCEVTLYRYIRKKGEQTYTKSSLDYELGPSNNYSDTLFFELLKEDTEYEFSVGDGSGKKFYVTDVFRTPKDSRSVAVTRTDIHAEDVVLHYALAGCDRYTKDYVKCYYRLAGFNGTWKEINSRRATQDGSFILSVLKEATDYEYLIGIASKLSDDVPFLTHTVRGTVTTRTDTRRLEVDVTASMTSAQLICRMFNMEVASYNHVAYFFREKGQEQWEILEDKGYYTNEEVETIRLEGLKENTVYEYRVGFKKKKDPDPAELKHVAEGEFRTAADLRNVEITVEPKTFSAGIYYTLSHMEGADDGYLLGYFRKASETEETPWEKMYSARTGHQDAEDGFVIGELEEETSYELTMGFGESDDAARDSLKRSESITFATTADSRSLSEAQAEVGETNVTLRVKFSGNAENRSSFVQFFYRVKGDNAYERLERRVNVSGVEYESVSATLTGLLKGTEYEFAAVLSNDGECEKPEDVTRDAYKAFGSFTTQAAVRPTLLKMSQERLHLNANALYKEERRFGYEYLKVQWEPAEAAADLEWKSSDKTVATVTQDGKVSALAAGTATITATSVYAPEVSASCEVTVGDYQIGRRAADGSISLVEGVKLTVARGVSCEGYVLCSAVDRNPVEVSAKVRSGNES